MRTKKMIAITVISGLLAASPASGLAIKLAPGGGVAWGVGDQIEQSNIGYSVGGSLELEIWRGFDYGLRYFYSDVTTDFLNPVETDTLNPTVDAEFIHHSLLLTNSWSPGWRWVDPYVRGGLGLYSWRQLDDNGNTFEVVNPQDTSTTVELAATSFGLSFGSGVRIWPTDWIGLRLGIDYDLIFSEDRETFGTSDANDNLLRVGGELIFRVPVK